MTNIYSASASDPDTSEDIIRTQRFELLHLKNISPNYDQRFIVEDLIFEDSLVGVYGASNTGKSFIVLDLVLGIARGVPWAGLKTEPRTVIYLAAEGGSGIVLRLDAYCKIHNIEKRYVPFYLLSNSINLSTPGKDSEELTELLDQVTSDGQPPIVVVDTLSRIMPGIDENSPNGMTSTIDTVEKLRHRYGATVILIHHTGKQKNKGMRGHSSLLGALDSSFFVDENSGLRTMEVDKQKDLAQEFQITFNLDVVSLKTLENGRRVTSCVVRINNSSQQRESTAIDTRRSKLTKQQRAGFDHLIAMRASLFTSAPVELSSANSSQPTLVAPYSEIQKALKGANLTKSSNAAASAAATRRTIKACVNQGLLDIRKVNGVKYCWLVD